MLIFIFNNISIPRQVEKITLSQIRTDIPEFRVGDTVKVDVKIIEGKSFNAFLRVTPASDEVSSSEIYGKIYYVVIRWKYDKL